MHHQSRFLAFISKNALYLVILLTSLFILYFYSPIIFHPGDVLLDDKGDSMKNYYVYEWHVQNDSSYVNYSGTNYPYGEHHGYTDGIPLLSNLVKAIPILRSHSIALFNLSIFLSIIICAVFLFKILTHFEVPKLTAVLAALGITILCPQIFRIHGHFALSYGFCIPLIIYSILSFEKRIYSLRFSLLICFLLSCIFFLHPYLGMICTSFVLLYWLIKLLLEKTNRSGIIKSLIIQGLIPIVIYYCFTKLTDTHVNRPDDPYGFLVFNSSIATIFISTHPPFQHLLTQIYPIQGQNWEGIAYIGIPSLFVLLTFPFYFIKRRSHKSPFIGDNKNRILFIMMISSLVLLMFSMGYPFKWNMEWLLEKLPLIKQFRVPGRFAWVFYFVMTISASIFISKYLVQKIRYPFNYLISSSLLILFCIEGIPYHQTMSREPLPKNHFKLSDLPNEQQKIIDLIKSKHPQAIIPIPFIHFGTDFYSMQGTDKIKNSALITSFHTKVPLMANYTARTSLIESRNLINVLGNEITRKEISKDLPKDKSFIVLFSKEPLNDDESMLLSKGKLIYVSSNYLLKELSYYDLFNNVANQKIDFFKKNPNLPMYKEHTLSRMAYFDFQKKPMTQKRPELPGNPYDLLEIPADSLIEEKQYEITFWYHTESSRDMSNELIIADIINGQPVPFVTKSIYAMHNVYSDKVIASIRFSATNTHSKKQVYLKRGNDEIKTFKAANIMIRQTDVDVYGSITNSAGQKTILINNYPFEN